MQAALIDLDLNWAVSQTLAGGAAGATYMFSFRLQMWLVAVEFASLRQTCCGRVFFSLPLENNIRISSCLGNFLLKKQKHNAVHDILYLGI